MLGVRIGLDIFKNIFRCLAIRIEPKMDQVEVAALFTDSNEFEFFIAQVLDCFMAENRRAVVIDAFSDFIFNPSQGVDTGMVAVFVIGVKGYRRFNCGGRGVPSFTGTSAFSILIFFFFLPSTMVTSFTRVSTLS